MFKQIIYWWTTLLLVIVWSPAMFADDDEHSKSKVSAPPNTVEVASTLGGGYFVDKELVNLSKALKEELTLIRNKIRERKVTSSEAIKQLELIESKRVDIAKAIETQKILISAFNVYTKNETIEFPLSKEKLVIVTGDRIRIRSWAGPGIKCKLEKTILAKTQPEDSEFDEIKIIHQAGNASAIFGRTTGERWEDEVDFLESEEGRQLTNEQLARRKQLIKEQIIDPKQKYAPFQGKECNHIQLNGLTWNEGNRQLSMTIESDGGGASHSSQWRRHAKLTIYIPACNWVLARGCLCEVDIAEINANVMLTSAGSRDRDYEGRFIVSNITGNVTIDQVPVRGLANVNGNVVFVATEEFVNHGTRYQGGNRTAYSFETASTSICNVTGSFKARFLRTNLEVKNVEGAIDVQNEFGDTNFKLEKPFDVSVANRIVSESGTIQLDVDADADLLSKIPLYSYTLSGTLHSNLDRTILEESGFSTGNPRRNWHGFVTASNNKFSLGKYQRPRDALENRQRSAGLDLISRGGSVKILGK